MPWRYVGAEMLPSHAIVSINASYGEETSVVTVQTRDAITRMYCVELLRHAPQAYAWCPMLGTYATWNEFDWPTGPGSGWTESEDWTGTYEVPECVKAKILKMVAR